jgi:hypothetical protein
LEHTRKYKTFSDRLNNVYRGHYHNFPKHPFRFSRFTLSFIFFALSFRGNNIDKYGC